MKKLSIISPVYQEEAVIARFHSALTDALKPLVPKYLIEYVYVVDKSSDQTESILENIAKHDPHVRVIVLSRRFGHQAALIAGLDTVHGDAVVMLDSDLQHPPTLIPQLVECFENGADIVQTIRAYDPNTNFLKRITSHLFYRFLSKMAAIDFQPGISDFRLLSARVLKVFQNELKEFNPFLRGLVSWVGFNVQFVPFTSPPRTAGHSKYTISKLFNFAAIGICSFSRTPLRVCSILGIFLALMSFVLSIFGLIVHWTGHANVPGWASLFCAFSFISGVQLLFLGILGEYVASIFEEVKRRPRYLVERVIAAPSSLQSS